MKVFQYIAAILVIGMFSFSIVMAIAYLVHGELAPPKVEEHSILEGRVPLSESEIEGIYLNGWIHGCKVGHNHINFRPTAKNIFRQLKADSIEFHNMVKAFPKLKANGHF